MFSTASIRTKTNNTKAVARDGHDSTNPVSSASGAPRTTTPFNIETTLTYEAIQHWAQVDPDRTALITTKKQWKCDNGILIDKKHHHDGIDVDNYNVDGEGEWQSVTYGEFWDKVIRMRIALHRAGMIVVNKPGEKPPRLLLLYAPTNRADVLALLIALQAMGIVLLFGTPDAFGGIRNFFDSMLQLQPNYIIANKVVYTIFRGICMTLPNNKNIPKKAYHPTWIKSTVFTKIVPKLSTADIQQFTTTHNKNGNDKSKGGEAQGVTLDTVTAIMFSSGTTGPPTPIEITQRMLAFQANEYAQLLQKHLGHGIIRNRTTITGMIGNHNKNNNNNNATTSDSSSSSSSSLDNNHTNDKNDDCLRVSFSRRDGPWISTHIFVNFVMLDLVLGGTAVMQPMGLSSPDKTVDVPTLIKIWNKYQTQVTSAPPALWRRILKLLQQQQHGMTMNKTTALDSLQIACIGGAETSASFANSLSKELFVQQQQQQQQQVEGQSSGGGGGGCALYRVYGTTQVLPIATVSDFEIKKEEATHQWCAKGYGVCLGTKSDGLNVQIDTKAWEGKGGLSRLTSYHDNNSSSKEKPILVGELCALGKAVSPSMQIVCRGSGGASGDDAVPTRIFRSGDVCYVNPDTNFIYFLGRMSQAVDCGDDLKLVPPVGVEMVCLETGVVDRCAFVGVPHVRTGVITPTLVVQFEGEVQRDRKEMEASCCEVACRAIRIALEKSVWAALLKTDLSLIAYSKTWPVDSRHSSKTNRFHLRDWAAKADQHKYFSI